MSNKIYDWVKWFCLIGLPIIDATVFAVLIILKVENAPVVLAIMTAVEGGLGMLVAKSSEEYYKRKAEAEEAKKELLEEVLKITEDGNENDIAEE